VDNRKKDTMGNEPFLTLSSSCGGSPFYKTGKNSQHEKSTICDVKHFSTLHGFLSPWISKTILSLHGGQKNSL